MSPQQTAHPITAESLVPEILGTLLESRRSYEEHHHEENTPRAQRLAADRAARERAVTLDVTLALIIRHRLPIDADATTAAVRRAQARAAGRDDDARFWALGCAGHVSELSRHHHRRAHHRTNNTPKDSV
ncbi:hypothetical protein [Streptomyces sp. NPDC052042]|uniref:hypothetical protein n=1 Tax=Streptomyces sp. NPDC052042 TaxID=3365683 RepID=UPI0037D592B5